MNVYGIQLDIAWEDRQANFDRVTALLKKETIEPGSLIGLPEMFASGFSMNVSTIADDDSQLTAKFLKNLALKYQSFIIGGLVTRLPDGRGRNQTLIANPSGKEIARYTKMHPFSYAGETDYYAPGDGPVFFSIADFTAAPFICYDLRFPEAFRHAVTLGANVLIVIACWPKARRDHWRTLLRARAIENQAYVLGVNRCGRDPNLTYAGDSMIVDPQGTVLAYGGNEETVIKSKLDKQFLDNYRHDFPALNDIRQEYKQS